MSQPYFDSISASGPIRYNQYPFAIGVLEAPDNLMPSGMASPTSRTEDGLKVWKLHVHGADVPGRWVIVDREFRLAPG